MGDEWLSQKRIRAHHAVGVAAALEYTSRERSTDANMRKGGFSRVYMNGPLSSTAITVTRSSHMRRILRKREH